MALANSASTDQGLYISLACYSDLFNSYGEKT